MSQQPPWDSYSQQDHFPAHVQSHVPPPQVPVQWQQQPAPYQPQWPQQVAPKSTAAALIMSFFVPGLGSMYAGQVGMGVLILVFWLVSWPLLLAAVGLVTLPACWIWGMVAGYTDARAWNRAHGIIS